MSSIDTDRTRYIAELRAFADLIESNPAIPAPNYASYWVFIHAETNGPSQEERFEQIHDFADQFGAEVTEEHDGDRKAKATFGIFHLTMHAYADKKPAPRVVTRPSQAARTREPQPAAL